MNEKLKDEFIKELTRLLIKTDFYEHQHNVDIYVKKTRIYKDMIKMVKELLWKEKCKTEKGNYTNNLRY